jgi:hypothetical protein
MRQLAKLLFLLALAGCSTSGGLFQQEEPKPVPMANQPGPAAVPQQASPNRSNLSPAASAAAPAEVNEAPGELMDCVTESCRINCSPKVAEKYRPKWCTRFKEPI